MVREQQSVTTTEDGRYIVVDGRRWRATDPAIPEGLRAELVSELMAARRSVGSAKSASDTAAARRRVHDAKVALGERGAAWWDAPDEASVRNRIIAALRTLLRKREWDATVCPSDIARIVGGVHWRDRMDSVRAVIADLCAGMEVEVRQRGQVVPAGTPTSGAVRVGRGRNFDAETAT